MILVMEHGHSGYTNYKCRCDVCSAAAADYQRVYQIEYRRKNKEKKLAQTRGWYQANKATQNAKEASARGRALRRKHSNARRARQSAQFVEHVDPWVLYEMHGGRCGICEEFVARDDFHVDHVIPLSKGGLHAYANCQPAHPFCNLSKHDKITSPFA